VPESIIDWQSHTGQWWVPVVKNSAESPHASHITLTELVQLSLYVVGLKGNVSEAEHPLLCEGTRRQKGELAVAMLVQYKDDTAKLARVCIIYCLYYEMSLLRNLLCSTHTQFLRNRFIFWSLCRLGQSLKVNFWVLWQDRCSYCCLTKSLKDDLSVDYFSNMPATNTASLVFVKATYLNITELLQG